MRRTNRAATGWMAAWALLSVGALGARTVGADNAVLNETRQVQMLDGEWRCSPIQCTDEKPGAATNAFYKVDYDDSKWGQGRVTESEFQYGKALGKPFHEVDAMEGKRFAEGWYRYTVKVPADQQGRRAILHFERVKSSGCQVWVNGVEAGSHKGRFAAFDLDVTAQLKFGADNLIAVRYVESHDLRQPLQDAGVTLTYGLGIMDCVSLVYVPPVYVESVRVTPRLAEGAVQAQVRFRNSTARPVELEGTAVVAPCRAGSGLTSTQAFGRVILKPGATDQQVKVNLLQPHCWSPEDPFLYNLDLVLKDPSGRIVESRRTRFGYREFVARDNSFYLNGKRCYLRGTPFQVNLRNSELDTVAARKAYIRQTLRGFKYNEEYQQPTYINVIYMPCADYSDSSYLYDLCDEEGLMVYGVVSLIGGAAIQVTPEYLTEGRQEQVRLMEQLYNHPSITLWDTMGEGAILPEELTKLYQAMRQADPSGRPIGIAGLNVGMTFDDPAVVKANDFIDLHNYIGWYDGGLPSSGYEPYLKNARRRLEDSGQLNGRPLLMAECGNYNLSLPIQVPLDQPITPDYYWEICQRQWLDGNNILFNGVNGGEPAAYGSLRLLVSPGGRDKVCAQRTKEYFEAIRQGAHGLAAGVFTYGCEINERIASYNDHMIKEWTIGYNPVYTCLDDMILRRNLFAGGTLETQAYVINDGPEPVSNLWVRISAADRNGLLFDEQERSIAEIPSGGQEVFDYRWRIPENLPTGRYSLRICVYAKPGALLKNYSYTALNRLVSYNEHPVFVLGRKDNVPALAATRKTAVFQPAGQTNTPFMAILADLRIAATPIGAFDGLDAYTVLLIPPGTLASLLALPDADTIGRKIRDWVGRGGIVACLEQKGGLSYPWLPELSTVGLSVKPKQDVDLVIPEHPLFKGLPQAERGELDTAWHAWNEVDHDGGEVTASGIAPVCLNMLAFQLYGLPAKSSMAIAEVKVGKGVCLMSQAQAVRKYGKDSIATKYLKNLLAYVLTDPEVGRSARPLVLGEQNLALSSAGGSWTDTKIFDGDLKTGWTQPFKSSPQGQEPIVIERAFPQAVTVRKMMLYFGASAAPTAYRLEYQNAAGQWVPLAAADRTVTGYGNRYGLYDWCYIWTIYHEWPAPIAAQRFRCVVTRGYLPSIDLREWVMNGPLDAAVAKPAAATKPQGLLLGPESNKLKVVKVKTAPVLDGKLDDPVWQAAAKIDKFYLNDGTGLPKKQTTAYVMQDDRNLYLGLRCQEPDVPGLKTNALPADWMANKAKSGIVNRYVFGDDCVEVFLDTAHDRQAYYHLGVNAAGIKNDRYIVGVGNLRQDLRYNELNDRWQAKTFIDKDYWSVEIVLPLAMLGEYAKPAPVWGFNLARNQPGKTSLEYSVWQPTFGSAHTPSAFGELEGLVLPAGTPAVGK